MRKTLTTAALLMALSCPAFAGEMHTPPAPQPTPQSAVQEPTTTDEDTTGATEILTQLALDLVSSVLPLL
jgi:hypothetical protein